MLNFSLYFAIKTEGYLDLSHLTQKLPSKASYRKKDKGRDESDKKTRENT
jgi:hypothetical protein